MQVWRHFQDEVDGVFVLGSDPCRDDQVDFEPRRQAVCDRIPQGLPKGSGRIYSPKLPWGEVEKHPEVYCEQPAQRARPRANPRGRKNCARKSHSLGTKGIREYSGRDKECEYYLYTLSF